MSFAPTAPQTPAPQTPTPQSSLVDGESTNATNEKTYVPIAPQEWQTYENLSDAIHIDYPAAWEKTQQENNLIFLAPPDPSSPAGSFRTGVGIIEEPSLGMTLDSYANKSTSDLQSRIPSGSFVVLENAPLPGFRQGIDALKSVYQWQDPRSSGLLKTMETYLVTPDKAYTISYAAPVSLFDKYLPVAQRMLDSFQPVPLASGQGMTSNYTQPAPFSNVTGTGTGEGPQFTTYQNSSFGSLEYPSNWRVELGGGSVYLAAPRPANESLDTEAVGFFPLESNKTYDPLPKPNEPIDKYFSEQFNNFKNKYPTNILVDGPSPTAISGNPAMKARFTSIERNNLPYDTLEIWTTNKDKTKVFQIVVTSKKGLYPSFPSAHMQRIIDSFQMASPLSPPVNNNASFQSVNPNATSQIGMGTETGNYSTYSNTTSPRMAMETGNYSTYSNTTSGITVQYPSNWGIDDSKAVDSYGVDDLVKFYPREGRTGSSDTIFMVQVDPYVSNNISTNDYLNKSIESLDSFLPNFEVVDAKTTDDGVMLSGRPAYQIVYTNSSPFDNTTPFKSIEVGTIVNGKAYFLTYGTSPSKFDANLSTIKKLIDSFRLSKG